MLVFGIDPGFANLGVAIVDFRPAATRVLHADTLRTTTKATHAERMDYFTDRFCELIEAHNPVVVGYENQAGVEVGMQRDRADGDGGGTNFSSRKVHEVVGAIRATARFYALPCYTLAPSTIKVALLGKGGGHASKQRMRDAVARIFRVQGSEHVADAVAVAIATCRRHRVETASVRRAAALIR